MHLLTPQLKYCNTLSLNSDLGVQQIPLMDLIQIEGKIHLQQNSS